MKENNGKPTWDSLALDIAGRLKAAEKAKNLAIIILGIAVIAISISLTVINYRNDCDWRKLFASYDYVSQDGEGINNINSGEQGDLINGSTGEIKKRQDER